MKINYNTTQRFHLFSCSSCFICSSLSTVSSLSSCSYTSTDSHCIHILQFPILNELAFWFLALPVNLIPNKAEAGVVECLR